MIGLVVIPTYWTVLVEVSYEFDSVHLSSPPFAKQDIVVGLSVFFLIFCMKFDIPKVRKVVKLDFLKQVP